VNLKPGIELGFWSRTCRLPRLISALRLYANLRARWVTNGLLDSDTAAAMERITGVKHQGVRTGKWLRKGQATDLLKCSRSFHTQRQTRSSAVPETLAEPSAEGVCSAELCRPNWDRGASGRELLLVLSAAVCC
jgi:hypothetical protein